ncbi:multicopper oxidase [Aspergillus saccharolyticus JOP 1030-1]|uniref:Multicopper oxidase n=1 Tax=Aspergillus saccharolyticus JOP 1030-1 TaxID=1450539 RepID=A0A318Z9L4_9EURO|nr:multicopper oxidase [Aspergillus saccharolyticus JOP 1030-1]PYH43919.1 multicopper oxidase [Aspergillus saccharolyticus JOP 1030-1]
MFLETYIVYIINFLGFEPSFSPFRGLFEQNDLQVPITPSTLSFVPPGAAEDDATKSSPFRCYYSAMASEYTYNPSANDRGVWLKHRTDPSKDFTINTDYEVRAPVGIARNYFLTVGEDTNHAVNWDGVDFPYAKVFNKSFPGPWIQACWGDVLNITVKNTLPHNGTAIHMHGIRQFGSALMDGVPGITQCPIAPGDTFSYVFNTTQYGSTWYHSHYSLQYSDGLLGPLTIHGPTSANFDSALDPILISDHNHRSAFMDYYQEQFANPVANPPRLPPKQTSILINGHGSYAGSFPLNRYHKKVKPNRRYILRLINASTDSTFIFSIDGHNLTVVGNDLVPVEPYTTNHIYIGIGQRYHVVLETLSQEAIGQGKKGYWIRTEPADGCHNFETFPDDRQGILWYGSGSASGHEEGLSFKPPLPTTTAWSYNSTCSDMLELVPVVPWTVAPPDTSFTEVQYHPNQNDPLLEASITIDTFFLPAEGEDAAATVNVWQFLNDTVFVNYTEPTVNNLDPPYNPNAVIYLAQEPPAGSPPQTSTWNYMVLIGGNLENPTPVSGGRLVPAAHPIHLHGHDFAVLQFSEQPYNGVESLNLELDNPRRRDAVLLPSNGFIVIAFKTDNPGVWTLHCHIAWHASAGLALQDLELKDVLEAQIEQTPPTFARQQLDRTCANWDRWFADPANHWNPNGRFQDDSGI